MEVTSKNQLTKLSLQELKILSKEMELSISGSKTDLTNRIWEFIKPLPIIVNTHPDTLSPPNKKIIGIKKDENEKLKQVGSQVEKKLAKFVYYSMSVYYYEVNKDFNFM
jgi:hypothetical protein